MSSITIDGEWTILSIYNIGKPDYHVQKNETGPLSNATHKLSMKWIKN